MQSTVEPLEGNKVKLSVAVEANEINHAVDAAAKKLAREVRMPGFRPGKVPRRVLESRMGRGALREEALRESLPGFYADAIREHEVDVIAPPEIDITEGEEDGDLRFEAVVEIRPTVAIPGYAGLQVTVERPEATDDDVDKQVDRLRGNDATLETVSRPAKFTDVVTIDLAMSDPVEVLAGTDEEPSMTPDYSYTLGSAGFGEGFDANLDGCRPGDILAFTAEVTPGQEVAFKVLVKEVREQRLPDLTDAWASDQTDFDTVVELRDDLRERITKVKRLQATLQLRERALTALVELVTDDAPAPLVDAEVERRVHDLGHRLEREGATIDRYLAAIGQEPEQFIEEMRSASEPAVKADLALRALADAEEIEALEEDIDDEIAKAAEQTGLSPAVVRRNLVTADQLPAVRSDIRKSKAMTWLLEHVDVVDPEGQPINRAELELTPSDEPDHQHDDHEHADHEHHDDDQDGA